MVPGMRHHQLNHLMSIENDIHQTTFESEYHKMSVNLIYTYNWAAERAKKFFEKADLTSQQYNILRILRGAAKPMSTLQIRQRMLDKMSDTSRIVDRLLRKELVCKVTSKSDRRLVDVTISPKGLDLLNELDKHTHELDSHFKTLTVEEARTVNHLLDKLRNSG